MGNYIIKLRNKAVKNQAISLAAQKLKAIANENRLKVLFLITEKELSVGEIEKEIKISQSALSQHLAVLRNHDIVKTRRLAQTIFYRLKDENIRQIIELISKIF